MASTGLTPRHRQGLVDLAERGPTSHQALLETRSVDPSVLGSIRNGRGGRGLAERGGGPTGRRRHSVEMSSTACEVLGRIEQAVSQGEAQLFADLGEAD